MPSSSSAIRAGSCAPCLAASAALTAPQPSWPSTTKSGVCRCTPAYCSVPITSGEITIARDPDDEQLAETGIENQFGRHARIAAPDDGRVRMLTLGERGEQFLLNGRKPRFATDETLVAGDETRKRLVGGHEGLATCKSGRGRPAKSRRQGIAINRAHRADRLTRALSVAIPVFAYIWR